MVIHVNKLDPNGKKRNDDNNNINRKKKVSVKILFVSPYVGVILWKALTKLEKRTKKVCCLPLGVMHCQTNTLN